VSQARIVRTVILLRRHVTSNLSCAVRFGGGGVRRICGAVARVSIIVFLAFCALADDASNSRLSDDIALTKATVSLLVARDFSAVRDRFDPSVNITDDTLRQMSDVFGASEPTSIEMISSHETHNLQTGDGTSRTLLEYELADKWVVVDAVVKTEAASKQLLRLFLTVNALPLRELNAFHLFGKGPGQYLFLAVWMAAIVLTGWAILIAFRRHTGWRRWGLIALMPLGLGPPVAMNWVTAQVFILGAISNSAGFTVPIFAIRYPMAMFDYTETGAPFLYISVPLIAIGYLWRMGAFELALPPAKTD
jgi:hypothetical protein